MNKISKVVIYATAIFLAGAILTLPGIIAGANEIMALVYLCLCYLSLSLWFIIIPCFKAIHQTFQELEINKKPVQHRATGEKAKQL